MADEHKPFDAAAKLMIDAGPGDWLALAGLPLPANGVVVPVDAVLSTVHATADKLLRVGGGSPDAYLANFEFQSSPDRMLEPRLLLYNALGRLRDGVPVRSVVFLMHPRAAAGVTGRIIDRWADDGWLDFGYRVVRVWQLPVEPLLAGPLWTLPLAPIADVPPSALPDVVERVRRRLSTELPPGRSKDFRKAMRFLFDLRYPSASLENAMITWADIEQTASYQQGRDEGRVEGRVEGRAQGRGAALLELASEKFGPPPADVADRLSAVVDVDALRRLTRRVLTADSWDELLTDL